MSELIYHITSPHAWEDAQARGEYHAPSLSVEGFIHCSTIAQVLPVAENFYKGQKGLIVLVIDPAQLNSRLQWESPSERVPSPAGMAESQKFPHIYGPLNLNAVTKTLKLELNADGKFTLPPA